MANTIKAGQSISGETRWDYGGNSVYKGICEYSKHVGMSQPTNEDKTAPNAFLHMLDSIPAELAHDLIPPGKIKTFLQTSKKIRECVQEYKPRITIQPSVNGEGLGSLLSNGGQDVNLLLESLDAIIQNYEIQGVRILEVYFANRDAKRLFEKLQSCKNLTDLDISYCKLTPCQLKELAEIPLHCTGLAHLQLGGNDFGDEGVADLADALPRYASLTRLDLSYNRIYHEGINVLAPILPKCTLLVHFSLFGNSIGDEGADKLAAALAQCRSLERLELAYNEIGNQGAESLATVLHACTSLSFLGLEMNLIGDEGYFSILTELPRCTSLVYLNLLYNEISTAAGERLREFGRQCPGCEIYC